MRVFPSLLLASVAVAACVTSTPETTLPKSMDVDPSTRVHATADTHGAASTDRLLRTSDNADDEDRGMSPVMATATAKALPAVRQVSKTGEKVLSTLKRMPQNDEKTLDVLRQAFGKVPTAQELQSKFYPKEKNAMAALDSFAINNFYIDKFDSIGTTIPGLRSSDAEVKKAAKMEFLEQVRKHENKRLATSAAELFKEKKNLIDSGASIEEVISGVGLQQERHLIFATPKVELLKLVVKALNEKHQANLSLLDAFVIGLGSEGEVARTLGFSMLSNVHGGSAYGLQGELLERWLTRGKSPDDVVAILMPKDSGTDGITPMDAFVVHLYIGRFNLAYPNSKTDVVTCLRKYVKDRALAIWIAQMETIDQTFFAEFKTLMRPWLKANEAPKDLNTRFFTPVAATEVAHANRLMSVYQTRFDTQTDLATRLGLPLPTKAQQQH